MRAPILLQATLLTALALCLSPTPTSAADRPSVAVLVDRTGDVWTTPVGGDSFSPDPDRRVIDATRMRAVHRHAAVVVTVRFVALRRTGRTYYELDLRSDTGGHYAQVAATRRVPAGRHHLWDEDGDRVACAGMTHTVDYAADLVTLHVPRGCLDAPSWIRVRQYVVREAGDEVAVDNPHNDGARATGYTSRLYRR